MTVDYNKVFNPSQCALENRTKKAYKNQQIVTTSDTKSVVEERIHTLDPNSVDILLLEKNLETATPNELVILTTLMSMDVPAYVIEEFLKGGYLLIHDDGKFYTQFKENCQNLSDRSKKSSHKSDDPQYAFEGPFVKECLFGTKTVNGEKCTWIQLERHNTSVKQLPGHMTDYFKYVITKENQGPYGSSIYTESNPLEVSRQSVENTWEPNKQAHLKQTIGLTY